MASTLQTLALTPYGVSVFTDTQRRKSFVTLFFRHEKANRQTALAFPGLVLDALTAAGLTLSKSLDVHFTPLTETGRVHSETGRAGSADAPRLRCYVEAAVTATLGTEADLLAWAEQLTGGASR